MPLAPKSAYPKETIQKRGKKIFKDIHVYTQEKVTWLSESSILQYEMLLAVIWRHKRQYRV